MCEQYMTTLWYALEIECHPSVRQNLEWLVLILLKRYPKLVDSAWDVFKLVNILCIGYCVIIKVGVRRETSRLYIYSLSFTNARLMKTKKVRNQ